mmetsp:Transcript_39969/g.87269  ORF Transcript_39969/g.87269 Transcript_39969/m.87269 type:complete len:262 (-) Transcript_39969:479-1264(-)
MLSRRSSQESSLFSRFETASPTSPSLLSMSLGLCLHGRRLCSCKFSLFSKFSWRLTTSWTVFWRSMMSFADTTARFISSMPCLKSSQETRPSPSPSKASKRSFSSIPSKWISKHSSSLFALGSLKMLTNMSFVRTSPLVGLAFRKYFRKDFVALFSRSFFDFCSSSSSCCLTEFICSAMTPVSNERNTKGPKITKQMKRGINQGMCFCTFREMAAQSSSVRNWKSVCMEFSTLPQYILRSSISSSQSRPSKSGMRRMAYLP